MGGLIKWLKKDGTARTRRRESAPLQFFNKRKPTDDEVYRESLVRFRQFREHERIQRLSVGANELAAYHSISEDQQNSLPGNTTPTNQHHAAYQPNTCPSKSNRTQNSVDKSAASHQNGKLKKISVQFHLNESTADEYDSNVDYRKSRHSMPATTSNTYTRSARRLQNPVDAQTIEEEEREEFEEAHCMNSVNYDEQSALRSPPMKFYKKDLSPFPINSETSSLSTLFDAPPVRGVCPEKPKRSMPINNKSRKLLSEAHFTGQYKNFEIQSPYYTDTSSIVSSMGQQSQPNNDTRSLNDENQLAHYQVIVNKHGDEVEYALPCVDMVEYQRRLTKLSGDNSKAFDQMTNENCEMTSNTSISMHEQIHINNGQRNGRFMMITDLDKSIDSLNPIEEFDNIPQDEHVDSQIRTYRSDSHVRTPNRVIQFQESMQCADIICEISEFDSVGRMKTLLQTPLHFEWGSFKNTAVSVRKYANCPIDNTDNDFTLIAETAIICDAEILRKIRHPNIVNLMAIAFEPFRRLALIMEPTKCSLNHHLFVKNKRLDLIEVVMVLKRIAGAVSYLHEFGICHSNISSHAILVGEKVTEVKLSSFELAVSYQSDVQNEPELLMKQKTNRSPPVSRGNLPKLNSEQKIEHYKKLTTAVISNTDEPNSNYSLPFIRDLSTKYFPYYIEYRRIFSLFYYQAPELLSQTEQFVFPVKQTDTYALALLLWEMLNQCIPFVIYDEVKLDELLKTNYPLKFLPIVEEERCQRFNEILERGLKRDPATRIDLNKMIRKLSVIETEIQREKERSQSAVECCFKKKSNTKSSQRRSMDQENMKDEKMTPDKSTSKLFSIITSPKPSPITLLSMNSAEKHVSPLNNVTNNTFYRSILDFNKLLSPRRDTNDETYQRSSTLKKRKKVTPVNNSKRTGKDLFGDTENEGNDKHDKHKTIVNHQDSDQMDERLSSGRPSNEFNNALFKSAISKELDYTNEEQSTNEVNNKQPVKKGMEQPFGPKDGTESDLRANINNSSYRFVIDDYELPQELIARNNKIRRCTWLSSDHVNNLTMQNQLSASVTSVQTKGDDVLMLPTLNESNDSSKKLNVSIKIVHKQVTPEKNTSHNDSMKSDCSMASAGSGGSSEDSFSVKSRIKFFRSLESQPVQRRTPNKYKINASRRSLRSEMSFNEAKKSFEKAQRHTFPSSNPPQDLNRQLIDEITAITADIKSCLAKNKHLNEKKTDEVANDTLSNLLNADITETDKSLALFIDDILNNQSVLDENAKNASINEEETEKRNSVRETVQKFESSMRNEKNENISFPKIENKLLNEKIFNTDLKFDTQKKVFFDRDDKQSEVTDEKVEDVIRFEAPCEAENECGPMVPLTNNEAATENGSQQSQALIKRTFYQESIISGTNMEMPELKTLLVNSPNVSATYATSTKSSLTTRVTLNMRKCRRRSSDVGSKIAQYHQATDFTNEEIGSPMSDVRHSICGSQLAIVNQNNPPELTSGRRLEQISSERFTNHASGMLSNDQLQTSVSSILTGIFNRKQIQSIEDLYIDDDFGGMSLAANMKLMANSTDSLDNINFNLISTHIFEQTSESTMTTNTTTVDANAKLNAIDEAKADQ